MKQPLTLTEPITVGENTISEIEIRKPTTGDIRGLKIRLTADGNAFGMDVMTDDLLTLVGRCANLLPSELNKLSLIDVYAAGEVLLGFMQRSPTTGSNG